MSRVNSGASQDPPMGLAGSAAEGGRWGAVRSVTLQLFTVASTMVLARILTPADFGLVAAATVIVGVFEVLTRFGFGTSLVRREELDDDETSTIFWLATGAGVVATLLAALLATPLARLIGQPDVTPMIIVLASLIPLRLAGNIGRYLLLRELRFRTAAIVEVAEVAVYLVVVIGLALAGFGPWAIVIGHVIKSFIHSTALLLMARWRPRLRFESHFVRDEMRFSGGLIASFWVHYLNTNLDYWVVSAALGAEALGIYYVAYVIPNLVRRRFTMIAQEVLYPILSRIGDDVQRVRSAYLRVARAIGFLLIPAMIGMAVLADVVVDLAFGTDWGAASGPLAILSISAAVISMSATSGPLILATGRPYLLIPAVGGGTIVLGIGLAITTPTGDLTVMAWAVMAAAVAAVVLRQLTVSRLIDISLGGFLVHMVPIIAPTAVMASALLALKPLALAKLEIPVATVLLVAFGVLVYLTSSWIVFRSHLREQTQNVRMMLITRDSQNVLKSGDDEADSARS